MQLSRYFKLEELTESDKAKELKIANIPGEPEIEKLKLLATSLLQPIRERFGPMKIDSGYRCPKLNKAVKGQANSQHVDGEAADIIPLTAAMNMVFDWIVKESGLKFGQCILEKKDGKQWIHVSLPRTSRPNQMAMTYDGKEYRAYV